MTGIQILRRQHNPFSCFLFRGFTAQFPHSPLWIRSWSYNKKGILIQIHQLLYLLCISFNKPFENRSPDHPEWLWDFVIACMHTLYMHVYCKPWIVGVVTILREQWLGWGHAERHTQMHSNNWAPSLHSYWKVGPVYTHKTRIILEIQLCRASQYSLYYYEEGSQVWSLDNKDTIAQDVPQTEMPLCLFLTFCLFFTQHKALQPLFTASLEFLYSFKHTVAVNVLPLDLLRIRTDSTHAREHNASLTITWLCSRLWLWIN